MMSAISKKKQQETNACALGNECVSGVSSPKNGSGRRTRNASFRAALKATAPYKVMVNVLTSGWRLTINIASKIPIESKTNHEPNCEMKTKTGVSLGDENSWSPERISTSTPTGPGCKTSTQSTLNISNEVPASSSRRSIPV